MGRMEFLLKRIDQSRLLDAWGTAATRKLNKIIKPGPLKNLMAGTLIGHPAHPMLTDVTIGAWVSALVLDLVGTSVHSADVLIGVGVLAAVPTALTGITDLIDCTDSRERAAGTLHAIGGVASTGIYALSFIARTLEYRSAGTALSILGLATVSVTGFLGGHLTSRRGVGVDRTVFEKALLAWTPALPEAELPERVSKNVHVDGAEVLLRRENGCIFAIANRCTHRGGPLHVGRVQEGNVTCLWHHSVFRLGDGSVVCGPATAPQPVFKTRVNGGIIEIQSSSN